MVIRSARITNTRNFYRNFERFYFYLGRIDADFFDFNFRFLFRNGDRDAAFLDLYLDSIFININLICLRKDSSIATCVSINGVGKGGFRNDANVRSLARRGFKSKIKIFRCQFIIFKKASKKSGAFTCANRCNIFANAARWLTSINTCNCADLNCRLSAIFNCDNREENIGCFQIGQRLCDFRRITSNRISSNNRLRERISINF